MRELNTRDSFVMKYADPEEKKKDVNVNVNVNASVNFNEQDKGRRESEKEDNALERRRRSIVSTFYCVVASTVTSTISNVIIRIINSAIWMHFIEFKAITSIIATILCITALICTIKTFSI